MPAQGPPSTHRRADAAAPDEHRVDTIDFWRGFILCTIFINHVPGNVFERLTYRNFGFSDSSEAFVFVSGLSLALAYGRSVVTDGVGSVLSRLARRAVKLYAVHIGLSAAGIGIFALGAHLAGNIDLMNEHGRDLVGDDPVAAIVGVFSLGHQFGYFNILPLYVLLVGMAPVFFLLARVGVPLMLAASCGLYAISRLSGLNVPTWPMRGTWFFDPFAWQLLLAIGIAVGFRLRSGVKLGRWTVAAAVATLGVSAVFATDGFGLRPGLYDVARASFDLDKTTLGLGRVVHFLALACCLHAAGAAAAMRNAVWFRPLSLIGRNGLAAFGMLSLLAAAGQVIAGRFGHTLPLDAAVIGGGLLALYAWARLLTRMQRHGAEAVAMRAV